MYMVDISRPAQPLALMIFPGYGTLASQETTEAIRRKVETVRVGECDGLQPFYLKNRFTVDFSSALPSTTWVIHE